jgi:hypothetical protein
LNATPFLLALAFSMIWHPATATVKAPTMRVVESREAEPPVRLPTAADHPGLAILGQALFRNRRQAGRCVAIRDQADESLARGPIRQEVTRVATPEPAIDRNRSHAQRSPEESSRRSEQRAIKQPRHYVLKQCEAWMNDAKFAIVPVADMERTTPAVASYICCLDSLCKNLRRRLD